MTPNDSTVALQIVDSNKVLLTVGFVDGIGEPVPAVPAGASVSTDFLSSSTDVIVTPRGDGITADGALISPPPATLPTGVTVQATTTITNADGTISGPFVSVSDAVDFVVGAIAGTHVAVIAE